MIPSFPLTPATPITPAPVATAEPVSVPSVPMTPATPSTTTGSVTADSSYKWVVWNKGSTFVYLRSSPNSSSNDNVLMKVPNGTGVELLKIGENWSYVQVGNVKGYIVTKYLKRNIP